MTNYSRPECSQECQEPKRGRRPWKQKLSDNAVSLVDQLKKIVQDNTIPAEEIMQAWLEPEEKELTSSARGYKRRCALFFQQIFNIEFTTAYKWMEWERIVDEYGLETQKLNFNLPSPYHLTLSHAFAQLHQSHQEPSNEEGQN